MNSVRRNIVTLIRLAHMTGHDRANVLTRGVSQDLLNALVEIARQLYTRELWPLPRDQQFLRRSSRVLRYLVSRRVSNGRKLRTLISSYDLLSILLRRQYLMRMVTLNRRRERRSNL